MRTLSWSRCPSLSIRSFFPRSNLPSISIATKSALRLLARGSRTFDRFGRTAISPRRSFSRFIRSLVLARSLALRTAATFDNQTYLLCSLFQRTRTWKPRHSFGWRSVIPLFTCLRPALSPIQEPSLPPSHADTPARASDPRSAASLAPAGNHTRQPAALRPDTRRGVPSRSRPLAV